MQSKASTPAEYIDSLPEDRKPVMQELRKQIRKNLPKGFKEEMNYGMLGYVVPHSIYPDGYKCDPKLPLPFMCIASQKNHISLYHMGIGADKKILNWFTNEYSKQTDAKLDMGKGCIRFKNLSKIPYKLIGELSSKMSTEDWINTYEKTYKNGSRSKF